MVRLAVAGVEVVAELVAVVVVDLVSHRARVTPPCGGRRWRYDE